jgi:hypothetical protein
MPNSRKKAVAAYRRRLKRDGFVRLEVNVHKDDALLVRGVVAALTDPQRKARARSLLRRCFGTQEPTELKELLASAPLEGVDLERERDFGRDIDL